MNIYKKAVLSNMLFSTTVGELNLNQVYLLPMEAKGNKLSLTYLGNSLSRAIKEEESALIPGKERIADLMLRLEIIKDMLDTRAEKAKSQQEAAKAVVRRRNLAAALEKKRLGSIDDMTIEEIEAELNAT